MEVLLIGEAKLKIVLTEDEVKKYKLDITEPMRDTARCRRGLWNILEAARGKVSFDPTGDKVLIQLYPTKGGCEMFVTKLGILSPASAKLVSGSDRITLLYKRKRFYLFEGADSLLSAVRAIKKHPSEVLPRGDLYISGSGAYYLSVEEYGKHEGIPEFPSLTEFGDPLSSDMAYYVEEHFNRVTDGDAIERLTGCRPPRGENSTDGIPPS